MKLRIPTAYEVINAKNAKAVTLVVANLRPKTVWEDGAEVTKYSQRPREEQFRLGLEVDGIPARVIEGSTSATNFANVLKGAPQELCIVTAELCYQTMSIAHAILRDAPAAVVYLEFTEESVHGGNFEILCTNARRYKLVHLLQNLVYLRRHPGTPRTIEVPEELATFKPPIIPEAPARRSPIRKVKSATPHETVFVASDVAESSAPSRRPLVVSRIVRDSTLSRKIKMLHRFECQICGHFLSLSSGLRYAEGHHLQPLGAPHNGPDVAANILCLCPNHHAELDFGIRKLTLEDLKLHRKHQVGQAYLDYHNETVCG